MFVLNKLEGKHPGCLQGFCFKCGLLSHAISLWVRHLIKSIFNELISCSPSRELCIFTISGLNNVWSIAFSPHSVGTQSVPILAGPSASYTFLTPDLRFGWPLLMQPWKPSIFPDSARQPGYELVMLHPSLVNSYLSASSLYTNHCACPLDLPVMLFQFVSFLPVMH